MSQDDPAFHTAALPRLYNEYQQVMASVLNPDNDKAIELLTEIRDRTERALAAIRAAMPKAA